MQLETAMAEPAAFAASVRTLLSEDPRRFRWFGAYWFFVKALLKRFYDRHQMPMLGDYDDPTVSERLPPARDAHELIAGAIDTARHNAMFNLGRNRVEDPQGEFFTLSDPDIGL